MRMGLLFIFAIFVRSDRVTSELSQDQAISGNQDAALAYSLSQGSQPVTVTFNGCTFSGITTQDNGGALWLDGVKVIVNGECSFTQCVAQSSSENSLGGAIYVTNADTVTIADGVSFSDCDASQGGGIYATACASVEIGAASFTGCGSQATKEGSSLYIQATTKAILSGSGRVKGQKTTLVHILSASFELGGWTIDCTDLTTELPLHLAGYRDVPVVNHFTFNGNLEKNNLENGVIRAIAYGQGLRIDNCIFNNLKTASGAFRAIETGGLTIQQSEFTNVVSSGSAAVVYSTVCYQVVIEGCTISHCACQNGFAISVKTDYEYETFTVKGVTFDANSCSKGIFQWTFSKNGKSGEIKNCTFKNHEILDQEDYCFFSLSSSGTLNRDELRFASLIFIDNVFRGTNGICSLPAINKLVFEKCEFDNTSLAELTTDVHKGLIVIPGDGAAYEFLECVLTGCHVLGKGGLIVGPEVSQSKMLAGAAGDVLLQGCEFKGCSSEQTAEVYIQCSKLTVSGGTFSCPETKTSSFIEVWITGTTDSTISATFSVDGANPEEIANPMITLHSVEGSKTNFQECKFTTTVENPTTKTLYVSLQNHGSVSFDKTVSFDVDVKDAVTQEDGFTGNADIQTPEPEPSGDTGGSGSGSGSSGGSSPGGDNSNNDKTELIVGVTCGVIAVLIVAGVVVVFVLMFRRRRRFTTSTEDKGKGKDDAEEPVSTGSATDWAAKPGDDWDRARDPGFAMQGSLQYTADAFD